LEYDAATVFPHWYATDNEPNRDTGVRARQSHRAVYFLMKSPRKVCLQPQLISEVRQRSLPSTRSRSTVVGFGFVNAGFCVFKPLGSTSIARWPDRGLPPFSENRPPIRSARRARKSRRPYLQAPSSPWRFDGIRLQSACRTFLEQERLWTRRQKHTDGGQARLSCAGAALAMSRRAPEPSTNSLSGCSVLNVRFRAKLKRLA
jgi:hypothetical protein